MEEEISSTHGKDHVERVLTRFLSFGAFKNPEWFKKMLSRYPPSSWLRPHYLYDIAIHACLSERIDVLELLYEVGIPLEPTSKPRLPLSNYTINMKIYEWLKQHNVELQFNKAEASVYQVCSEGMKEVAEYMVDNGADLYLERGDLGRPIDYALLNAQEEFFERFHREGERESSSVTISNQFLGLFPMNEKVFWPKSDPRECYKIAEVLFEKYF